MGDFDTVVRHFDAALAMNMKMEAPPLTARTQVEMADVLLKRDQSGDHERAIELLESARATTEMLGMRLVHERACLLLNR